MATHHAEQWGMSGSGGTKSAAKKDAAEQCESLVRDVCDPIIVRSGSGKWGGMIFRAKYGWFYSIILSPDEGLREDGGCSLCKSRDDAERSLRRHLADLATDCADCHSAADVDSVCKNADDRREIASMNANRRKVQRGITLGLDRRNADYLASGLTHLMTCPVPAGW